MTDEEIEKALERCKSEDLPCQECAYWHIATQGYNCRNALIRDVADYINRLKEACQSAIRSFTRMETLYILKCNEIISVQEQNEDMHGELMSLRAYIDNHEEVWKQNAEINKAIVRKDTAKEILFELKTMCPSMFEGLLSWIDTKLKHYGV